MNVIDASKTRELDRLKLVLDVTGELAGLLVQDFESSKVRSVELRQSFEWVSGRVRAAQYSEYLARAPKNYQIPLVAQWPSVL